MGLFWKKDKSTKEPKINLKKSVAENISADKNCENAIITYILLQAEENNIYLGKKGDITYISFRNEKISDFLNEWYNLLELKQSSKLTDKTYKMFIKNELQQNKITDTEKTMTIATDLGYVSNEVYSNLADSDFTILEANYDDAMLEFGKYPYMLKRRIKGQHGHLSNDTCGQTIARLANDGHTKFLLAHLSENNNTQELALQTVESILSQNGVNMDSIDINLASKALSNEGYTIC